MIRFIPLLLLVVSCASNSARTGACGPAAPVVTAEAGPLKSVSVEGSDDLAIFVAGARTPIAGQLRKTPSGVSFSPHFALEAGRYEVVSRGGACRQTLNVARAPSPTPAVEGVFPASGVVPENLLRFYIYFSQPMEEGEFLSHVRLRDLDTGAELSGVFFDNLYELWSPDRKRITLLVDPGRVKTGLAANQRLGRAFVVGHRYALEVLPSWKSVAGVPLSSGFAHRFVAAKEDINRVDPDVWTIHLPVASSREPIRVEFHRLVDHVSVGRFLRVLDEDRRVVAGRWALSANEREATFTPAQAWSTAIHRYALGVAMRFEDVVGNNVNAAFEHDVADRVSTPGERVFVRLLADRTR